MNMHGFASVLCTADHFLVPSHKRKHFLPFCFYTLFVTRALDVDRNDVCIGISCASGWICARSTRRMGSHTKKKKKGNSQCLLFGRTAEA